MKQISEQYTKGHTKKCVRRFKKRKAPLEATGIMLRSMKCEQKEGKGNWLQPKQLYALGMR